MKTKIAMLAFLFIASASFCFAIKVDQNPFGAANVPGMEIKTDPDIYKLNPQGDTLNSQDKQQNLDPRVIESRRMTLIATKNLPPFRAFINGRTDKEIWDSTEGKNGLEGKYYGFVNGEKGEEVISYEGFKGGIIKIVKRSNGVKLLFFDSGANIRVVNTDSPLGYIYIVEADNKYYYLTPKIVK
ncbi:MAG: hypothetical protein NTW04_01495 [Elusimicrobia bacterium]|nr:hypothetical protein [Elusimicrobiota bacterium]